MTPPRILGAPERRRMLAALVALGLVQAALAVAGAFAMTRFISAAGDGGAAAAFAALLALGAAAMAAQAWGRALAERFGQAYIAACRARLLKAIVRSGGETGRHGIAMTRLISDLASVKNWVALGIAGGAAAAATLAGLALGAAWLSPAALAAIALSSALTLAAALATARPLRRAIRDSREIRGALAARVGEAVLTAPSVRMHGALDAEKNRIHRLSEAMARRLATRFWWATMLRRSPELGLLGGVALLGLTHLRGDAPQIGGAASGIVMLAAAAAAQRGLARALDLRLSYGEGRRRLVEALEEAGPSARPAPAPGPLGVACERARITPDGRRCDLAIAPGARVAAPAGPETSALMRVVAGLAQPQAGAVRLIDADGARRTAGRAALAALLISPEAPLRRGSVRANLRLGARAAGLAEDDAELARLARLCGVWDDAADDAAQLARRLPEAGRGAPPSTAARLRLARALLARPGALLIDDPVFESDPAARHALARAAAATDATVIVAVHGEAAPIPVTARLRLSRGRFRLEPEAPPLAAAG